MDTLASKKSIDVNGVKTHYFETGRGNSCMLLLHSGLFSRDGFCADATMWEFNLPDLGESFRVVAPDMLGQGETALPPTLEELSYDGIIDHIRAFLVVLGIDRVHVVGHDQGGLVAMRLAIESPELIQSCTVINSPTLAPSGDGVPNFTLEGALQPLYSRASQAWILERQSYTPHHIYLGQFLSAADTHAKSSKFAQLRASLDEKPLQLQLTRSTNKTKIDTYAYLRSNSMQVPVLLVWGVDDPMSSTNYVTQLGASTDSNSAIGHARAVYRLLDAGTSLARMSLINRAGYMPFRERPEVFNEIVAGFARAVDADHLGEQTAA